MEMKCGILYNKTFLDSLIKTPHSSYQMQLINSCVASGCLNESHSVNSGNKKKERKKEGINREETRNNMTET